MCSYFSNFTPKYNVTKTIYVTVKVTVKFLYTVECSYLFLKMIFKIVLPCDHNIISYRNYMYMDNIQLKIENISISTRF